MADDCCKAACGTTATLNDPRWRRALWIALGVNAGMFAVEMAAGAAADSRALQADALDFLGDATNYAISLLVAGMALAWRARAALAKGLALIGLGGWVMITAVLAALGGAAPEPELMGVIGALALAFQTTRGSGSNTATARNDAPNSDAAEAVAMAHPRRVIARSPGV